MHIKKIPKRCMSFMLAVMMVFSLVIVGMPASEPEKVHAVSDGDRGKSGTLDILLMPQSVGHLYIDWYETCYPSGNYSTITISDVRGYLWHRSGWAYLTNLVITAGGTTIVSSSGWMFSANSDYTARTVCSTSNYQVTWSPVTSSAIYHDSNGDKTIEIKAVLGDITCSTYDGTNNVYDSESVALTTLSRKLAVTPYLDGTAYSSGIGDGFTFDVTVAGTKVADDVKVYSAYHTPGASYTINDFKTPSTGYQYTGSSSYTGTLSSNVTKTPLWTTNYVCLIYDPNGGTISSTSYGTATDPNSWTTSGQYIVRLSDNIPYWQTVKYGASANPHNDSTFGLTRSGCTFGGWKVKSTGTILDQDTNYASTTYAHYSDSSITTANTNNFPSTLVAVWNRTVNAYSRLTGFVNGEGTSGTGNTSYQTESASKYVEVGGTFTYDDILEPTVARGFYLNQLGSSSFAGTWTNYALTQSFTQPDAASSLYIYQSPTTYSITYDLDGGTNDSSNPTSYNVLYGQALKEPTKDGYNFVGWEMTTSKLNYTLAASTSNYNYKYLLRDVVPGATYAISIDESTCNSGSADSFNLLIYDFTTGTTLNQGACQFGSNNYVKLYAPQTADPSHDIAILIYAGSFGSTANNAVTYTGVQVTGMVTGVNEHLDATFSSADDVFAQLERRLIGNVTLKAIWSPVVSTLIVNPNTGTWRDSVLEQIFYGESGSTMTVENPTKRGYTFPSWTHSGDGSLSGNVYTFD